MKSKDEKIVADRVYLMEGQVNEQTLLLPVSDSQSVPTTNNKRVYTVSVVILSLISVIFLFTVAGNTKPISSKLPDVSLNEVVSLDTYKDADLSGIVVDDVVTKGWTINKYTTSAVVGSLDYILVFVNTYVTSTQSTFDSLGCSDITKKLIGFVTSDDNILHVVDSSVFADIDRSIKVWSEYMESLGTLTHNVFMHNKIQLYVPDISPHYNAINGNVNTLYRLSSTSEGTDDIAHILFQLVNTTIYYEIVGPSATLSSDQLTSFSAWQSTECPHSHAMEYTISYLNTLYYSYTQTDVNEAWSGITGMFVPMPVLIQIPAIDNDNFNITKTLMLYGGGRTAVEVEEGNCVSYSYYLADSDPYDDFITKSIATIRYVINPDAPSGELTLADWENDVVLTHETYLSSDGTTWDRYLDQHVGLESQAASAGSSKRGDVSGTTYLTDADCTTWLDNTEIVMRNNGILTGSRAHDTIRYYVGNPSVLSLQFTVSCDADTYRPEFSDLCGCIQENDDVLYLSEYGVKCSDMA